jgi:hypothetical protein
MTATGEQTVEPDAPIARREGTGGGVFGFFRDPLRVFLLLAIAAGAYLACVVPHFGGIDEVAHFYRSYQISEGHFLPQKYGASGFSGACIPRDVILAQRSDSAVYGAHLIAGLHRPKNAPPLRYDPGPLVACPTDPGKGFVTFSTFGSPVPYLPQSAAILVARAVGLDTDGMEIAARLATFATFIALVWFAIRRTTRSKWAFAAVGLLPLALYQASSSPSHDVVTIAVVLLVVSSALRAVDVAADASRTALFVEAAVLTTVLAACKPGYVVLAGCYLLPLFGSRRRRDLWPLALAPVLGALVSLVWNTVVGGLWKTDAGLFGVQVDPHRQRHLLLTEPWTFAGAVVRSVSDEWWHWAKSLITIGGSVSVWPTMAALVSLLLLGAVSLQRAAREPDEGLAWSQRIIVLIVFVIGALLVFGAQYVYWSTPGDNVVEGMQARFFVPLLVLIPIAVGPVPWRWARAATARVPVVLGLIPVYVALAVTIAFRQY